MISAQRSVASLFVFATALLFLKTCLTSSVPPDALAPNHSYFPPHSPAAHNISNMVLLYADIRSLGSKVNIVPPSLICCGLSHVKDDEFHLNAAKVRALLQCDEGRSHSGSSSSSFFDTILVTGYAWDNMQKCFWPGQVVCVVARAPSRNPHTGAAVPSAHELHRLAAYSRHMDALRMHAFVSFAAVPLSHIAAALHQSLASINNASAVSSQPTKVVIALMCLSLISTRILHDMQLLSRFFVLSLLHPCACIPTSVSSHSASSMVNCSIFPFTTIRSTTGSLPSNGARK